MEALGVACPLCQYNLERNQERLQQLERGIPPLPVLYFTELLALALGEDMNPEDEALHYVDCHSLLQKKGLVGMAQARGEQ